MFTENKEGIQKFKETGESIYIYQKELDKVFFQHDMGYGDFQDIRREKNLIKFYVTKHLKLLKIQIMPDIKEILFQWFINLLIKILLRLQINLLQRVERELVFTQNKN